MRAVVIEEFKPYDQHEVREWPSPSPGPLQVKFRTQAIGVSFAESLLVSGQYQRRPPLPFVAGFDVAGIVTECGEGATRFQPGDRVCGLIDWGSMAEEGVALEVSLHKMPDAMSFGEATSIASSYATSAAALTWPHLLNVQAGDWLLVHGATGGVGLAAVEMGRILGAKVIATAGSAEKIAMTQARGADHSINYREQDFRDAVLEITGERGVDKVYDPVGGDVFAQSLRCMAPEGRICPIGFASGDIPQIPANILLVKNLSVCGLNLGYYYGWSPNDVRYEYEDVTRGLVNQVFEWYKSGRLQPPPIDKVFPLSGFREALGRVLARQTIGRTMLAVNEEAERLGVGA